eukprot:Colp12_sorted_trinity150504_noHs@24358
MEGSREQHLLTLKVMRLSKPALASGFPILCESGDLCGSLEETAAWDLELTPTLPPFGISETLTLPQNFGTIFLGQVFSSYVSVHNDSQFVTKDVSVKAELQTSSQRLTLADTSGRNDILLPDASVDVVVNHEVKELGIHILVCSVQYSTNEGEKMFFRKFFKFEVKNPLAVKTKVYNVEDDVFLEAQVQNIMPTQMFIESVTFDPAAPFKYEDYNVCERDGAPSTTFAPMTYLNPDDIRQYLYRLTPKIPSDKQAKSTAAIGKLDIVWRTNMGEPGRLQTSQLPRKLPLPLEVKVAVVKLPENVFLESPFSITVRITNVTERKMSLRLFAVKAKMSGVFINGVSGMELGELEPDASLTIDIPLFAMLPGLQRVTGLRVVDQLSNKNYDVDKLTEVLVLHSLG